MMKSFRPLDLMALRVANDLSDSDVTGFYSLLFYGEMLTKLTTLTMAAAIADDKDRHRYSIHYKLVRADGLGEWGQALDDILTGPASQYLIEAARTDQRQLAIRVGDSEWQYEAVRLLHRTLPIMDIPAEPLPAKVPLRQWYSLFTVLRNKTRGHGAPRGSQCADVCSLLRGSCEIISHQLDIFGREWAYIRRGLSGRYRVTTLGMRETGFDFLRKESSHTLPDGLYICYDRPRMIELLESDVDASDFLLANGQFNGRTYELLSYITNQKRHVAADPYIVPAGVLPESKTHGRPRLDITGNCFSNLPPEPKNYVSRPSLENELSKQLQIDRHPIITLTGPGGIGKTSLTLRVLHDMVKSQRAPFETKLWLSARDIDLLMSGPSPVRPAAVTLNDFAREVARLVEPMGFGTKGFNLEAFFADSLQKGALGSTLFVFDNFETVIDPLDVYAWVDTHIRLPNKALITTRIREFKGDYPIEIGGMSSEEASTLIVSFAQTLGITHLLDDNYIDQLISESDGHPYVMKILLGEVAKAGRRLKPGRIIATQDDILTALFERSYAALSPAAQRLFLILSGWRSVVPELALEAVVLRSDHERINVPAALEELRKTSFTEEHRSEKDDEVFVSVPLSASNFGRRKLSVSWMRPIVEADIQVLQDFGAARREDVRHGIMPRIHRLIRRVAENAILDRGSMERERPMLDFLASREPRTWLVMAEMYQDDDTWEGIIHAEECVSRYLENAQSSPELWLEWKKLAALRNRIGNFIGQVQALAQLCSSPSVPLDVLSEAANQLNVAIKTIKQSRGTNAADIDALKIPIQQVAMILDRFEERLDATGLSRLAWLHIQIGDMPRARFLAEKGHHLDSDNDYCNSLLQRLRI